MSVRLPIFDLLPPMGERSSRIPRSQLFAGFTLQLRADASLAPGVRQHPRTTYQRRVMSHVLLVPALQIGDPVAVFVLMETCNFPLQIYLLSRGENLSRREPVSACCQRLEVEAAASREPCGRRPP
jgi:hypothetical protein